MKLQKEILGCFTSEKFRQRLKDYVFTEKELLSIAYHYAPSFDERLRLMRLLAEHAPSVSDQAERCIAWQKNILERFQQCHDTVVYELHIKTCPQSYEDRYLCRSFETALEMLDGYCKEYDIKESPYASYEIVKRKILQSGQPFAEDCVQICELNAQREVLTIYRGFESDSEYGSCSVECDECSHPCISMTHVSFPVFISDRAPVRFFERGEYPRYGIHLNFDHAEKLDEYYIIPFDSATIARSEFDDFWCHAHIRCPYAEEVSAEELPPEFQLGYERFVAWLSEHYNKNYER